MKNKIFKNLLLVGTLFLVTSCGKGGGGEEHVHTFGDWTVDKAPTCMEKGMHSHTCSTCGATISEEMDIDPNAHEWGKWYETTHGTCSKKSILTRECQLNHEHKETKEGELDPEKHEWAIAIQTQPSKKEYNAFEEFNATGFTVLASCSGCTETRNYTANDFDYYTDEDLTETALEVGNTSVYAVLKDDPSTLVEIDGITVNKATESIDDFDFDVVCHTEPDEISVYGDKSGDRAEVKFYSDNACTQEITNWDNVEAGKDEAKIHKVYAKATLKATDNYDAVSKVCSTTVEHDPENEVGTDEDTVKCKKCNADMYTFVTKLTDVTAFDDVTSEVSIDLSALCAETDYKVYSDESCTQEVSQKDKVAISKSSISSFSETTLVKQEASIYMYAKETASGIVHKITIPCVNVTKAIDSAEDLKDVAGRLTQENDTYGYFLVTQDFDFGGSTSNYTNFIPGYDTSTWWKYKLFRGTFDGNNHTIRNVYVKGLSGIFGTFGPSTVKDINFVDCGLGPTSDTSNNYYTPFLAAYNSQVSLSNVLISFKDIITPNVTTVPAGYCLGNALLFSRYGNLGNMPFTNVKVDATAPGCTSDVNCVIASSLDAIESNPKTVEIDYKVKGYSHVAGKKETSTEAWTLDDIPNTITIEKTENTLDIQNAFVDVEATTTTPNEILLDHVTGADKDKLTSVTQIKDYETNQNIDWAATRNLGSGAVKKVFITYTDESNSEVNGIFNITLVTKITKDSDWTKTIATKSAKFKRYFILTVDLSSVNCTQDGRTVDESAEIDIVFNGLGHTINGLNIDKSGGIFGANHWNCGNILTKIIIQNVTFNSVSFGVASAGFSGGCGINQQNSYFKFIDTNITYYSTTGYTCLLQNNGWTQNFSFTNCNIDFGGITRACYFLYDTGKSTATNMPKFVNSTIAITEGSESSQGITRDNASNEHETTYDDTTQSYPVKLSGLTGVTFVKHVA